MIRAYYSRAGANSPAGVSSPNPERTRRSLEGVFFCARVLWRVSWGLLRGRRSLGGTANPVTSATLLFSSKGGGFPKKPETYAMRVPYFRLCERTGKYEARRQLSDNEIIKAAKKLLDSRVCRGASLLTQPKIVADYLITYFSDHKSESFVCIFLDNKHRIISVENLFNGTINQSRVYPREVVRRCVYLNAAAVIFAHNHPSGDIKPSRSDRNITEQLKTALKLIDVRTLDHFVVGGGQTYSFCEFGIL